MCLVPLLLTALACADADTPAEKAFQEMNATLARAKSFECTVEVQAGGAQGKATFKGRLVVAEGNKVRTEMEGDFQGKPTSFVTVSNGTKSVAIVEKQAQPTQDAPKNLSKMIMAALARGGVFVPTFLAVREQRDGEKLPDAVIEDMLKMSNFKFGKKEKIDGHEAQAIEYTLTLSGPQQVTMNTTLWIDTVTHLPVKRVLTAKPDGQEIAVTETYSKVTVDGKIDPKVFELPK